MEIIEGNEGLWRVAGGDTMAGRYVLERLRGGDVPSRPTLFLCEEDGEADADVTRRLLSEIEAAPPVNLVYLSSWQVYSPDAGEGVDETRPTFARSDAGRACLRCERMLTEWAEARGVTLTVVRPAPMFGKGMSGPMLRLFNRVVRGHYVHIRGNGAKLSAVTAYDVAKAMVALAGHPGIFNVSDGRAHTWLALAEAMTANAGSQKRMTTMPEKWARTVYRAFRWLPIVQETLSADALEPVSRTLTLDNAKVVRETGIEFHDTLAVIARTDKDYPYEDA